MGNSIRRSISIVLTLIMIFGIFPWQHMDISFAAGEATVSIYREFDLAQSGENAKLIRVVINDSKLAALRIPGENRRYSIITTDNRTIQGQENYINSSRIQIELTNIGEISDIVITDANNEKSITYSNISEERLPKLENVIGNRVDGQGPILINGTNIVDSIFESGTENVIDGLTIKVGTSDDSRIAQAKKVVGGSNDEVHLEPQPSQSFIPGNNYIEFNFQSLVENGLVYEYYDEDDNIVLEDYDYSLTKQDRYIDMITIIKKLPLDGIEMIPTAGQKDDEIEFKRDGLQDYDVYFVQDLANENQYDTNHKATYVSLGEDSEGKDVLKVKVPELPEGAGQYRVVITNKNSLTQGITARYVIPYEFTYLEADQVPKILQGVDPLEAPQNIPTEVSIPTEYVLNLNLPGYSWSVGNAVELASINTDNESGMVDGTIIIDYGLNTFKSGQYDSNNTRVIRTIRAYIGAQGKFIDNDDNEDGEITMPSSAIENIKVMTPITNDTQLTHKVKISIDTQIIVDEGDPSQKIINLPTKNIFSLEDFTYISSTEVPSIDAIVPDVIPVEEDVDNYWISTEIKTEEDGTEITELELNIMGNNFLITRTNDITNYPKVQIGDIEIDYNTEDGRNKISDFKVFNGNVEINGAQGNDVGDRIMVKLKAGAQGYEIPSNNVDSPQLVRIANPLRNNPGVFSNYINTGKYIEFKALSSNDYPRITSVEPNVVGVDSQEEVIITGSNFIEGAKVFIDGKEVSGAVVSPNNDKITFNAPIGRADTTVQLIVQNPNFAIATWPFTFTTTYTNPEFLSLNPPSGGTNTPVTIKGNNFKGYDPTVDGSDFENLEKFVIYRLIGTRIFVNNEDVNTYNIENGNIKLTPFTENEGYKIREHIVHITTDKLNPLVVGIDYKSSILIDENNKFYSIVYDEGYSRVKMTNGLGRNYYFKKENDGIIAEEFGNRDPNLNTNTPNESYTVEQNQKGEIRLINKKNNGDEISLRAYTPYYIGEVEENGEVYDAITGNRVFYKNSSELTFYMPNLGNNDKLCDIKVVNPDNKNVEKKGAFLYIGSPTTVPQVVSFNPISGSTRGGTTVEFFGPDDNDHRTSFVNREGEKTRVWIGEKEVDPHDVLVSSDGKKLTIKTPAYIDIVGQKTKNITIINPDGGIFKITPEYPLGDIYGFTYIQTSNNPEIIEVVPSEGSSVGGYEVEIWGKNFKDWEPFSDDNGNGKKDSNEAPTIDIIGGLDEYYDSFYNDENGNGVYDKGEEIYGGGLKTHEASGIEYIDSPLLPKVYFGEERGYITSFKLGSDYDYIKIIVPKGVGTVPITIINNDTSISQPYNFNYTQKDPTISSIIPPVGSRYGGDYVEISGTQLDKQTKVRFGNLTNKDLPRGDNNSGLIKGEITTVNLGNLTFHYDLTARTLKVTLVQGEKEYTKTYENYTGDFMEINTNELADSDSGERYIYSQLIELYEDKSNDREKTGRLMVEAGFAPKVEYEKLTQKDKLKLITPVYYEIGEVDVTVINPDGGEAKTRFTYTNPDGKPRITNITKDGRQPIETDYNGEIIRVVDVYYKGGNIVSIIGAGFRDDATIKIGDVLTIESNDIDYTIPSKMTFTMPEVPENATGIPHRVVVINGDGGTASSDERTPPIYIRFIKGETFPTIEEITPNKGPSTGGTKVTIKGNNFREEIDGQRIALFFGEAQVPDEDFEVVDYKTIIVHKTPAHAPGTVEVKVENPDGALSDPSGSFTYISGPQIVSVVNPEDPNETSRIKNIFADGGQKVKLKGTGFTAGSRVVFAPEIELANEEDNAGDIIYIDETNYILASGNEAGEIELVDGETLIVTTPPGKIGTKGVMVINPDGGASEIYEDIVYGLPEVDAPGGVTAELIYDRYIRISWSQVTGAKEYEIHAVIDGKHREFVGTTKLTYFVYEDLEPNTEYKFVVTALGEYGTSEYSEESNTVETGRVVGPEDKDDGLVENTQRKKSGNKAEIIIGTKDYYDEDISIDLTRGDLAGAKEVVVVMPAEVVSSIDAKDISIYGSDFRIKLNPKSFYTSRLAEDKDSNGVRFTLAPKTQNSSYKLSQGASMLSNTYVLRANVYNGQNSEAMDNIRGGIEINLDVDRAKLQLRRIRELSLSLYDAYEERWIPLKKGSSNDMSIGTLTNTLGEYTIIGNR